MPEPCERNADAAVKAIASLCESLQADEDGTTDNDLLAVDLERVLTMVCTVRNDLGKVVREHKAALEQNESWQIAFGQVVEAKTTIVEQRDWAKSAYVQLWDALSPSARSEVEPKHEEWATEYRQALGNGAS